MKLGLISLILLLFITYTNYSQPPDSSYFGGFFSYNFNYHKSDFSQLPGVPNCCPRFTEGRADGYSAGLFYEYALPMNLSISLKGGFNNIAGSFTVSEKTIVKIDSILSEGEFKHYLSVKLSDISINPTLNFRIFEGLSLHFGGHLGILVQNDFSQYEEISKPEKRGVFSDTETRRRNDVSGKIDSLSTVFGGLTAGISYRLPLNKSRSLWLVPEVYYLIGQTDFISEYKWSANSLKLGVALKYTNVEYKKPIKERTDYKSDTLRMFTNLPEVAGFHKGILITNYSIEETDDFIISVKTLNRTDTIYTLKLINDTIPVKPKPELKIVTDKKEITIKQDFATFYCPVMPGVFFDYNSPELPGYYRVIDGKIGNQPEYEPDDPLSIQKDILNIIGSRMSENPGIEIKLRGYTDRATEGGNCSLAIERAERVKKYLVEVWGIDQNRIAIDSRRRNCYPATSTSTESEMGYADNRRVEIITRNLEIFEPIVIKTPVDLQSPDDSKIKITPEIKNADTIEEWKIKIFNGDLVLLEEAGKILPSDISLDLKIISLKHKLRYDKPLSIEAIMKANDSSITFNNREIPLKIKNADKETKRIAFILFDIDKMILNKISESTLKSILYNLGSFSNMKITGFTDILGDYNRNKKLSLMRAQTIAGIIKKLKPEGLDLLINAAATDFYPFGIKSYNSQLERFISRSVVVELY